MSDQIKTERLILRPFTGADGARVVELLNNWQVAKWLANVPSPFGPGDLRLLNDDGSSRWPDLAAVILDGQVIGAVTSGARFGYWIGQDHWGHGYGGEAVRAMLTHAFERADLDKTAACVFEGNEASHRILLRLGFREVARGLAPCLARGEDIPNIEMELPRSDWEGGA